MVEVKVEQPRKVHSRLVISLLALLLALASITLAGCSDNSSTTTPDSATTAESTPTPEPEPTPDYPDAASFEQALNAGEDLTGKTVTFTVKEFVPDSAFGYNLQAGEHLNFVSPTHPGAKAGDTVTVKVTEVQSALKSWIISYEKL